MDLQSLQSMLPVLLVVGWACLLLLIDLFLPKERQWVTPLLAALGLIGALIALISRFNLEMSAFAGGTDNLCAVDTPWLIWTDGVLGLSVSNLRIDLGDG